MRRKTAKKITSSFNFIIRPHGHDIELDSVVFKDECRFQIYDNFAEFNNN